MLKRSIVICSGGFRWMVDRGFHPLGGRTSGKPIEVPADVRFLCGAELFCHDQYCSRRSNRTSPFHRCCSSSGESFRAGKSTISLTWTGHTERPEGVDHEENRDELP